QQTFLFDIAVQRTGQRTAETGQVRTTIPLGNVVSERQQAFVEAVVPLHRHFHADTIIALDVEMEYRVNGGLVDVQIFNEGAQTALIAEQFTLAGALINQVDTHTGVEERQFAQALGQDIPAETDAGKGL